MKVLITGGAGFIGSSLTKRLIELGHTVIVIDNLSVGRRANVPDKALFIEGDVANTRKLNPVFSDGIDAVCHIAGQVSLIRSFNNPLLDLFTNVVGTINIIQLCLKHQVGRLLYAGSMTAYDINEPAPLSETSICKPTSYYGITKYTAERYIHATANRLDLDFNFDVTTFRMFNVYGPKQALDNPYQGVLGIFIGNILRGEPITIFGDGEQTRDFIYIDDIVNAWIRALEDDKTFGKIFNLGSGKRLSINKLADHVLEGFGRKSIACNPIHAPQRPGEQRHMYADISMVRDIIGWRPETSFTEGLKKTIQWAKSCNVEQPTS
jgi:UDP-glucose 4-epimerase